MRVFKYKRFSRFAEKAGITDNMLKNIVADLEHGVYEANLGGNVYKKRVARPGEGKRGGYRMIVFFKKGERTFFAYGYPKSSRDTIGDDELALFKKAAVREFSLTNKNLENLVKNGTFEEVLE
jgi:hypothetical protein